MSPSEAKGLAGYSNCGEQEATNLHVFTVILDELLIVLALYGHDLFILSLLGSWERRAWPAALASWFPFLIAEGARIALAWLIWGGAGAGGNGVSMCVMATRLEHKLLG